MSPERIDRGVDEPVVILFPIPAEVGLIPRDPRR